MHLNYLGPLLPDSSIQLRAFHPSGIAFTVVQLMDMLSPIVIVGVSILWPAEFVLSRQPWNCCDSLTSKTRRGRSLQIVAAAASSNDKEIRTYVFFFCQIGELYFSVVRKGIALGCTEPCDAIGCASCAWEKLMDLLKQGDRIYTDISGTKLICRQIDKRLSNENWNIAESSLCRNGVWKGTFYTTQMAFLSIADVFQLAL